MGKLVSTALVTIKVGAYLLPLFAHVFICSNIAAVMITDVEQLDGQRGSNSSQNEVKITFLWGLPYCTFGARV